MISNYSVKNFIILLSVELSIYCYYFSIQRVIKGNSLFTQSSLFKKQMDICL